MDLHCKYLTWNCCQPKTFSRPAGAKGPLQERKNGCRTVAAPLLPTVDSRILTPTASFYQMHVVNRNMVIGAVIALSRMSKRRTRTRKGQRAADGLKRGHRRPVDREAAILHPPEVSEDPHPPFSTTSAWRFFFQPVPSFSTTLTQDSSSSSRGGQGRPQQHRSPTSYKTLDSLQPITRTVCISSERRSTRVEADTASCLVAPPGEDDVDSTANIFKVCCRHTREDVRF